MNRQDPPPPSAGPSEAWPHRTLWEGVRSALLALPAYFRSDTFIEGVNATDVFTLNAALGATIETQVVETLNQIRSVWDKTGEYRTFSFVRQPQSFPDVVLRNLADESAPLRVQPVCGIKAAHWLEFFKIFHQDATDAEIAAAFDRLRRRVDDVRSDPVKTSVLAILSSLEKHLETLQ